MLRLLVLLLTLGAAFGVDTFPLGTPNVVTGPDLGVKAPLGSGRPQTIAQVIAQYPLTTINTTGPTYTCATGSFDPYTNAIKYPNQRRQRPITINGTTYQADLIEGAATCLLTTGTCEYFSVGWTTGTGVPTITDAATTGVAGDTDAASFVEGAANGQQEFRQSVTKAASSLAYADSIYVKNKSGSRSVVVELDDGTTTNGVSLTMNPSTGAIVSAPAAFGAGWALNTAALTAGYTITSVGSGWYRVVLAVTSDTTTTVRFRVALYNGSTTSYAGNGTSGIYVWGAGLVQANWASSFISCRNLLTRSEDWSGTWGVTRASISADSTANPLTGSLTADTMTEDNTATNTHQFNQTAAKPASSLSMTCSIYLKAGTRSWFFLGLGSSATLTNGAGAYFDLTNGATGSTTTLGAGYALTAKTITAVPNQAGWYRCAITVTTGTQATVVTVGMMATADNTRSYTGNGTGTVILYGCQTQYGSAATTYWATSVSGPGIRNNATLSSTQSASTTEGTVLGFVIPLGWSTNYNTSGGTIRVISETSANNVTICKTSAEVLEGRRLTAVDTGTMATTATSPFVDGALHLTGLTWNASSVAVFVDGAGSGFGPTTPPYNATTLLYLGMFPTQQHLNGYVLGLYSASVIPGSAQAAIFAASAAP